MSDFSNWKLVRLRDVCNSTGVASPEKHPDKTFVYVDVSSVSNTDYRIKDFREVLGRDAPSRAKRIIQTDDVIFATVRPTLMRIALIPLELNNQVCSTGFCVLRAKQEQLLPYYLYFYLLTSEIASRVEYLQKGAIYPAINDSDLFEQKILLPPLPEQRAIAGVLRAVQEAGASRRAEVDLERERKAALMAHLFTHGTRGEAHQQTALGPLPASWQVVRLGDYCYKPDYGYTESATIEPIGPKFLRITDITEDGVNWRSTPYCACDSETRKKYLLKAGDLVVARIGATTGKAYLIGECPEAVFASYLIRIRPKPQLSSLFLSFYFQSNDYWLQIDQNKGGRLKGGVNIPILQSLVLPLPSLPEQQEIASVLRACDRKIAALEREAAGLDELFRALLADLMSGQRSARPLLDPR